MDLAARKISFVQEVLKIKNEELLLLLEQILKQEKKGNTTKKVAPMSLEELNDRINESLKDSEKGRLTESSDLLSEVEKWS